MESMIKQYSCKLNGKQEQRRGFCNDLMAAFPVQLNRQYVPLKVRTEQEFCFSPKVFASFRKILKYSGIPKQTLSVGKRIDKAVQKY